MYSDALAEIVIAFEKWTVWNLSENIMAAAELMMQGARASIAKTLA